KHTSLVCLVFFFQAEDGIRDRNVTGVQTCALPILLAPSLGPLSVHGIKNLLQQLPRALLPPGNAGTDPGSHAVFRSKDAAAPSRYGSGSHDLLDERKEKTKRRTMI